VTALSIFQAPAHGFCIQCAFLCACAPDPVEMMAARKALDADREDEAGTASDSCAPGGAQR
jgi:hypothetical protein